MRGRGRGLAWRYRFDCRSRAAMLVLLTMMMMIILAVEVESTRVRGMVAAIETSPSVVEVKDEFQGSVEVTGAPGTALTRRARSSNGGEHWHPDWHPVWDVETESPPAQRQRDRSLWGMSKRLVPTGPNPLHN